MRFDVRPAASGGWLALAAGRRLLMLPELDDPAAALEALEGADGFRRAVDLLTAKGLTAMPPFVLVETSVEPRLIVRGDVSVTIEDAQGRREVDAGSVSTWVEQVVPGLVALEITVPGAVAAIDQTLPIREGVALAASLRAALEVTSVEASSSLEESVNVAPVEADEVLDVIEAAPAPPTVTDRIDAPPPLVEDDPHATVLGPFDIDPTTVDPFDESADDSIAEPTAEPDPAPSVAGEPGDDGYDYLFGETVFRSVSEAAVPEASDDEHEVDAVADVEEEAPRAGDHDGETMLSTDIAKLRAERARGVNAGSPTPVAAPVPSVVLPGGARERLDQPLIFGRSPSASQVTAGSIPKLITLGSGDQDISRNHVRLALEGGTVVVTDLHSVNGTSVVLPGRDAQRLRAGEPTSVIIGTVVDLGGGVTLTVVED